MSDVLSVYLFDRRSAAKGLNVVGFGKLRVWSVFGLVFRIVEEFDFGRFNFFYNFN